MIGDINQDNLYLLLPCKVCCVADKLVEFDGMTIVDAIRTIYESKMYQTMEQEDTKLWHLGPVDLYRELGRRQNHTTD